MPDTTVDWGLTTLTKSKVTDSSLSPNDREKVCAISVFDCFPPPGSVAEFVHPTSFSPEVLSRYLQRDEVTDLLDVRREMGPAAYFDRDTILDEISRKLGFRDFGVWYSADAYLALRRFTPCFKTTIYLRMTYDVYEVKVTANREIKLNNKTFPAGDEIATYRVRQPKQFRFETYHEWNPRCCPERPETTPPNETTDWLPSPLEFFIMPKIDYWPSIEFIPDGSIRIIPRTKMDITPIQPNVEGDR